AGTAACRQGCGYFSVCGGGAPVNKLAENGSFRSGATAFCRLTQMVPTDLILDAFDRLERTIATDDTYTPGTRVSSATVRGMATG
ncbi:MAG TPA: hypothetical protein VGH34_19035, partial [Vicinamibacterales bacterium]